MHASDRYLAEGTLDDLRREEDSVGYAQRLRHGVIGRGLNDYDAIFRELAASASMAGSASRTASTASTSYAKVPRFYERKSPTTGQCLQVNPPTDVIRGFLTGMFRLGTARGDP